MKNCENGQKSFADFVANDIRTATHDEFSGFGFSTRTAQVRMLCQAFRRPNNAFGDSARCLRIILLDILSDSYEVGDSSAGPDYSHVGGGSSRFLPQERSQRAVLTCDTTRPSRTSFLPSRIAANCHS